MGITGSVELLVTPEVLNQKAAEVEKNVANMKTRFENMKRLVEKSKGYWVGEAGDQHRQNYTDQMENIDIVLRRLGEHPGDLRVIAQTYSTTELRIEETIIQALPGDVL
ncbi:MAG: WXG100 family type VII secretion target [Lachnospiraceae bacterium]|nr:WXG100 family type VII secretion target [Lachnospiraceae bacterium]